ncbi:hypothetical protein ACFUJR_35590 [Streptomyces sp. NPDC057271]|uniref:hypothetical protein n=1 Tax=unclassified Streptomyces TaxID=2593676 RepID=UPI0036439E09
MVRSDGGVAPCRFLRLEVPDAVRLGVLDTRFFRGGFPTDALLTRCFDLVETSALGGFAPKHDFRRDLGRRVWRRRFAQMLPPVIVPA